MSTQFEGLSDEPQLRAWVRGFVEKRCNRELTREWDAAREFPSHLYKEMADMGWLGLMIPEEYGGSGGSILETMVIYEELARYSVDIPTRLALTLWGQMNILHFGTDDQRGELLPKSIRGDLALSFSMTEPSAGSDAASLQTRAAEVEGGYALDGQKVFSSGAHMPGNTMVVAARTAKSRHSGISLFLVPSDHPGVELKKMSTIGRRILGTNEVFFTDVRIPPDALLGGLNQGWGMITSHLERERLTLAAAYLGNAQSVLDDAVDYARTREQFGKPIATNQVISHMLAEMATDVEAGRAFVYEVGRRYAEGFDCNRQAAMVKVFISEMWQRIAGQGMQILGGHAYTDDHAMQRYWRDARNGTVGGGTTQILREVIAREIVR